MVFRGLLLGAGPAGLETAADICEAFLFVETEAGPLRETSFGGDLTGDLLSAFLLLTGRTGDLAGDLVCIEEPLSTLLLFLFV